MGRITTATTTTAADRIASSNESVWVRNTAIARQMSVPNYTNHCNSYSNTYNQLQASSGRTQLTTKGPISHWVTLSSRKTQSIPRCGVPVASTDLSKQCEESLYRHATHCCKSTTKAKYPRLGKVCSACPVAWAHHVSRNQWVHSTYGCGGVALQDCVGLASRARDDLQLVHASHAYTLVVSQSKSLLPPELRIGLGRGQVKSVSGNQGLADVVLQKWHQGKWDQREVAGAHQSV